MTKAGYFTSLGFAALVLAPSTAIAQETLTGASETNEEIVVTARRRAENLQDTPVAVTALNSEALEERAVNDIADVASFAPNLTLRPGGSSSSGSNVQVFVRGVGQDDFLPTTDPGVGIYVDGVYLGRSVGGLLKTSDIAQIEVLRGPQGTLFGRNTIGGAINVTSIRPSFDGATGYIEGIAGSDNLLAVNGALGGPLHETMAARLAFSVRQQDGYGTSSENDIDYGNEDFALVRGQVLIQPTNDWSINLAADYYRQDQNNIPSGGYALACADGSFGVCADLGGGIPATSAFSSVTLYNAFLVPPNPPFTLDSLVTLSDPYDTTANAPADDDAEIWGVSATIDHDISEALSFRSISAYRSLDTLFASDSDGVRANISTTSDVFVQDQFSQEFQLNFDYDRIEGTLGAYYFKETSRDTNTIDVLPGLYDTLEGSPVLFSAIGDPPLPCFLAVFTPVPGTPFNAPPPTYGFGCDNNIANVPFDSMYLIDQELDTEAVALFGQFTYHFTNELSATFGARYSEETKDYSYSQLQRAVTASLGFPFYAVPPTNASADFDDLSPRLGVEYQPSDDQLFYASYSRGFRSGTFNGRASSSQGVTAVQPETLEQFEIGSKSEFADGRLRVNLALFQSIYQDLQITTVLLDPTLGLQINLVNAGEAEVFGGEAEILARVTDQFELGLNFAYASSEITEFDASLTPATGVSEGNQLPRTPEWSYTASAAYTLPIFNGELQARTDYAWVDKQYHDAANHPYVLEDAYGLLSGRLAYTDGSGWQISIFGSNLTDEVYFNRLFSAGASEAVAYPARGREWGVSLRRDF